MKILLSIVICIGYLLSGWAGFALSSGQSGMARVTLVIDGDSLVVERAGRSYQVRLWGIDSPEWGQRFSHAAKALCRDLAEGRIIRMQEKDRDMYGRIVAFVEVDGRVLNEEMIDRGMAWVHIHYCDEEICADWRRKEQEARELGRGLWADRHPLPPWKWKSQKGARRENDSR